MIDLHTHSNASDGQYRPAELIRLAVEKGLSAIALTDHDTVDGIPEAREAACRLGITFLPGIEISVKGAHSVKELHILGYGIDIDHSELRAMCGRFKTMRAEREARIFQYLNDLGISLHREQVEKYASHGLITRVHFARAMTEAGYVADVRAAFDRYLAVPAFDRIERPKPTPQEGIQCILAAGGVPVLAHPVQTKLPPPELERLLCSLKKDGLQGLECYYSTHTQQQTGDYLALAHRCGLIVTGGSDFHGEQVKPNITLGGFADNGRSHDKVHIFRPILEKVGVAL